MVLLYKYKAIDAAGKIRHDCIEAVNGLDLEQRLGSMGLELIKYKEKNNSWFNFKARSITRRELINFTFQMQQLTKSGVSILDGLVDIKESIPNGRMREVLSGIIDKIKGGKTFSEALAEFPQIFDAVYIALVKVGEETGRISDVLKDMAETLKWHDELIAHTKKIIIYPAIVTIVITAVVIYLMVFLVPELVPFIEGVGGEIPLHTRALISTSWFLGSYWYLVFGVPVILYFTVHNVAKINPVVRLNVDNIKLKVYIFGAIIFKTNLARFSSYFAMMYSSGLTVLDSLKISELLMTNAVLRQSIIQVQEKITEGGRISESFSSVNIYPPLVIRMLRVGENTGALDESLLNISYFYNREVKESVDNIEAAMSPVLTIVMGVIMMWIMSAVLGPIYNSLTTIQL